MSWLTTKELIEKVKRNADGATLAAFHGVFPIDELPFAVPHYPFFMIVNTQSHNLPGEHWISVFIDANRRGDIFDSFALPLSNVLIRWMNRFTRSFTSNRFTYQHPFSASCGAFTLYFILHRLHNSDCMTEAFTTDVVINEQLIHHFYDVELI